MDHPTIREIREAGCQCGSPPYRAPCSFCEMCLHEDDVDVLHEMRLEAEDEARAHLRDVYALKAEVDRLQAKLTHAGDAVQQPEPEAAHVAQPSRRPARPVWFKMPGDISHADRRTFAAGDDPCRHLDADDD